MRKHPEENTYNREAEKTDDEIDLIDSLRLIWKRKYLIPAGTILAALIALVISLSLQKVYRITMTIEPGLLTIGEYGPIYADTSESIKTLLSKGVLNKVVLKKPISLFNQNLVDISSFKKGKW